MDNSDPSIAFFPDHCIIPKSGNEDKDGYFKLGFIRGQLTSAHRIAYRMFKGEIPKNRLVMQTCDNRACINPKHLVLGTDADKIEKWQLFGDGHPKAKLNSDIVHAIRESDMTDTELAALYGVSRQCITNVRSGRTWKRVKAKSN